MSGDSWNTSGQEVQWAAFSPISPAGDMWVDELDEEHSSSEDEMEQRSLPVFLGEEGEVLLRFVNITVNSSLFQVELPFHCPLHM